MFSLYRVHTVTLRYTQKIFRDPGRIINIFFWPFFDVIIYGYMGVWAEQESAFGLGVALLSGAILSHILRANSDIAFNVVEEFWTSNLVNLFSSPLQFHEWILGLVLSSFMMFCIIVPFICTLTYLFYGFNLLSIGLLFIPIVLNLFFFGISIGFLSTSLLFYYGIRMQEIIFIIGWVFDPFSGAYYPVDVLPSWMRIIAHLLPLSYIFDTLRSVIKNGVYEWRLLITGSFINLFYLGVTILLLQFLFRKSLEGGLVSLSED